MKATSKGWRSWVFWALWLMVPLWSSAATQLELPIEDQAMIERAKLLDIEQRRYLTYLYARINKPRVANAIGLQVLAEIPSDRQTLLVLASLAAEQKQAETVVRLAEDYLEFYPGDHQGRYFLGAGYYMQGRFAESERILADLKQERFNGQRYPYETDLASAAHGAGQWYRSMLSYQELLRNHDLGDQLRSEVRRILDGIYRTHGPRVDLSYDQVILERGRVQRSGFDHAMHLTERQWWTIEGREDRVKIESAPGLLKRETTRADFATNIQTVWDARTTSEAGVGHGPSGGTAKLRLTHEIAPSRSITLGGLYNHRATDSLLIESLDGRQDRLELSASWLIESDLALNIRAGMRSVQVAGQTLGTGTGGEFSLDQTLRRQGAQWVVGYRGSLGAFSPTSRPLGVVDPALDPLVPPADRQFIRRNLVAPRINRHGVSLLVADNLTHVWSYRLSLGADYDFELDNLGYNVGLGWIFRPRKSIEIGMEGGYSSSADASNAGSSAYLLDLSFRLLY